MRRTSLVAMVALSTLLLGACDEDLGATIVQKLRKCDLLSAGDFNFPEIDNSSENRCLVDCIVDASCTEIEALVCEGEMDAGLQSCMMSCASDEEFQCRSSGERIPASWECDCEPDCEDGSDEVDCPPSACFECDGGWIIPQDWVCDCETDCDDGTDEVGCPASACFDCADGGWSIPQEYVCNGFEDCEDGSDEPSRCATYLCP